MNSGPGIEEPLETLIRDEMISYFVDLAQMLGIPKSVGQIYGLLYCSEQPLSFGEIVETLNISKGSASQGLKLLRSLGAVHLVFRIGERKDLYVAETELRKLADGFLKGQIIPRLEEGGQQLAALSQATKSDENLPAHLNLKLKRLIEWNSKSQKLLPWLSMLISFPKRKNRKTALRNE